MTQCKPGDTIGIIGGGQLGRMLAMAAARLGFRTTILDPQHNAPAFQCSNQAIVANYDDPHALDELEKACSVITYEFENVDLAAVEALESRIYCQPGSKALATSQDRLIEKEFFKQLGIGTALYTPLTSRADLEAGLERFGGRGIVKTRRFGYDGKGQMSVNQEKPETLEDATGLIENSDCILEGFVSFEREISVVAGRSADGSICCYDIGENVHRDGILHTSTVPAQITDETDDLAKEIARKTLQALDYVGVLAVELFVTDKGELLVNEFAPRVHNSGHWTEAACSVSQFEQHIRAVSGLPLGAPTRHSNCVMENLIGDDVNRAKEIANMPNTVLHLYGKQEARPGRKMGHFIKLAPKNPV